MHDFLDYFYLFLSAFISATLFPLGSEGVLLWMIENGRVVVLLVFVASVANTLGSLVNYYLGLKGIDYIVQKNMISAKKAESSRKLFESYGSYALLLSWVPIIGDPITMIAGTARYNLKYFLLIVAFAKTARYVFVVILYIKGIS
ncbi:MAG: hypothetical protein QG567_642 [Campylobacterota bacterium]|nr:hypothetical protein [Campylobacterota bacterium]